jgi:hypothetical protein
MRARGHLAHDYQRHGTTTLFAATSLLVARLSPVARGAASISSGSTSNGKLIV